jgi:hypothetical protein
MTNGHGVGRPGGSEAQTRADLNRVHVRALSLHRGESETWRDCCGDPSQTAAYLEEGRGAKVLRFKGLTEQPPQHSLLLFVEGVGDLNVEAVLGLKVHDAVRVARYECQPLLDLACAADEI